MISAISTLDLTRDRFMYDVIDGLSRPWKRLPPKYFYDAAGSRLFDRITELDEYYLTRSELAIMDRHAAEITARCGPGTLLIEPGAGNLTKVRRLLNHLPEPAGYVPIDVSINVMQPPSSVPSALPRVKVSPSSGAIQPLFVAVIAHMNVSGSKPPVAFGPASNPPATSGP